MDDLYPIITENARRLEWIDRLEGLLAEWDGHIGYLRRVQGLTRPYRALTARSLLERVYRLWNNRNDGDIDDFTFDVWMYLRYRQKLLTGRLQGPFQTDHPYWDLTNLHDQIVHEIEQNIR
jgi:hypothetical protein